MHASSAMPRFFVKAVLFVIGLGLIFNVLGTAADKFAPLEEWRTEHQQRLDILDARHETIEAITLGNSHSDAVDYSVLGMQGQSLAFAAADLFEVERYATLMTDELPNLKTVFIAVSYYSFHRDNATYEPFLTRRIQFYSMVPTWSPIRGDAYNFVLGRLESYTHVMSVVRSDNWKGVWSELSSDISSENSFPYDGVLTTSRWGKCAHYTETQLDSHAKEIAARNANSSDRMVAIHQGLEQDAFDALARTIEQLHAKGIRVVLFTPTYYEKYTEYFTDADPNVIDEMQGKIENLQQDDPVEYYDFSNDPEIENQPELFYNSDHLSDCGRKIFSAKLLQAMNEHPEN